MTTDHYEPVTPATELVVPDQAPPASSPLVQPRANLVRKVMRPFKRPLDLLRQFRPYGDYLPVPDLCVSKPQQERKEARERWRYLPDFPVLLEAGNAFDEGWRADADELKTRALVGVMLDALPSAKTLPSASYVDAVLFTLLHDEPDRWTGLTEFPPLAIAAAVAEVWRKMTFAPSPAELLELAREKRAEFHRFGDVADRLYELREQAEQVLIKLGDLKPPPVTDPEIPF
jgi:hypothetical protein